MRAQLCDSAAETTALCTTRRERDEHALGAG